MSHGQLSSTEIQDRVLPRLWKTGFGVRWKTGITCISGLRPGITRK